MRVRVAVRGGAALAVLAVAVAVAGCGGPPPELSGPESEGTAALELSLVLPADDTFASGVIERVIGIGAGQAGMILAAARPAPDDPPGRQTELVREAVERRTSALIVMTGDPQALAPALAEARAAGIPIVLIGAAVPSGVALPYPRVAFPPVAESAKALVDAAVKALADKELPAEGPARIASPENLDDPRLAPRAAALRAELQGRGITVLPDLPFSISANGPQEAMTAAMAENPRPNLMLACETTAVSAAMTVLNSQFADRAPFVIAGYIDNPEMLSLLDSGFCAAAVDGNLATAGTEALRLVRELIAGGTVPEVTTVPTPVLLSRREGQAVPFVIPRKMGDIPQNLPSMKP